MQTAGYDEPHDQTRAHGAATILPFPRPCDPTVSGATTDIPVIVLDWYTALGVTSTEWAIIVAMWRHWTTDDSPAVSRALLARHTGKTEAAVLRHLTSLERKGLLPI